MGPWGREFRSTPPQQETRGGNRVNWAKAVPGQLLPELPAEVYPEPDSAPLGDQDFIPAPAS